MSIYTTTAAAAIAELEAQPVLQPGETGWWKVWGARPQDIRTGDIVVCQDGNGGTETLFVEDTFVANAYPARIGFVVDGKRTTIGALCPIVLVRPGTRNTLADSV